MATMRLTLDPAAQRAAYALGQVVHVRLDVLDDQGRLQPVTEPVVVATLPDGTTTTYSAGWQGNGLGGWVLDILLTQAGAWSLAGSCTTPAGITATTTLSAAGAVQPMQVQPSASGTMQVVAVAATTGQALAARAGRRRLSAMNVGAFPATLKFGAGSAVAGQGIVLDPGAAASRQGGIWEEPAHDCWGGAVQAIGHGGATTIVFIEG